MLPFLPIVLQLLPDLFKIFSNEKGTEIATQVADAVDKAVKTTTGQTDPAKAQEAIKNSPALSEALQQKLAEIQLQATQAQNQAAKERLQLEQENEQRQREYMLAQLRESYAAAERQRAFDLGEFKLSLQDPAEARGRQLTYAEMKSPIQWVAPAVSAGVMIVFFVIILILLASDPAVGWSKEIGQIINITIGALVAAFTAVVNFWLGSSQGSRDKDDTIRDQSKEVAKSAAQVAQSSAAFQTLGGAPPSGSRAGGATGAPRGGGPGPQASTGDNFESCLAVTLFYEGGYSDDVRDPGGPTNLGITIHTLRDFKHDPNLTEDDVKKLTKRDATEIYRTNYWNKARCSDLPKGLDLEVFDMGVNAGPARSVTILQQVLGVTVDGSVGTETLDAIAKANVVDLIRHFSEGRLQYYRSLRNYSAFGRGWTNRVEGVQRKALAMAGA